MERSFDPMAVSSSTTLRVSQRPTVKSSLEHSVCLPLCVFSRGNGLLKRLPLVLIHGQLSLKPHLSLFPRLVLLVVGWKTAWPNDELEIVHTQRASHLNSLGLRLLTDKMGATVPILCTCCKL